MAGEGPATQPGRAPSGGAWGAQRGTGVCWPRVGRPPNRCLPREPPQGRGLGLCGPERSPGLGPWRALVASGNCAPPRSLRGVQLRRRSEGARAAGQAVYSRSGVQETSGKLQRGACRGSSSSGGLAASRSWGRALRTGHGHARCGALGSPARPGAQRCQRAGLGAGASPERGRQRRPGRWKRPPRASGAAGRAPGRGDAGRSARRGGAVARVCRPQLSRAGPGAAPAPPTRGGRPCACSDLGLPARGSLVGEGEHHEGLSTRAARIRFSSLLRSFVEFALGGNIATILGVQIL
ncbi:PREDICTED: translation initiation factor IF-2-like [Chinchilla lanigera]|uniref:translation initiation factor IF-2-like n=1 Tax=Chinchilla lanigera TaxID=34839 RepID=UPI0006983FA4|nr:PREDICTED: translation initiation factor IF-2-like [Chinchilla lanigera]